MVYCIKHSALELKDEFQPMSGRDIDVLLKENTKYCVDEKSALDGGYVPLMFITSVRTAYSNRVLEMCISEKAANYTYFYADELKGKVLHDGMDLAMFVSSSGIYRQMKDIPVLQDVMSTSQFLPKGMFGYNHLDLNPILYMQIVLDPDKEEAFDKALKLGSRLVPNNNLKSLSTPKFILDDLSIKVTSKGE